MNIDALCKFHSTEYDSSIRFSNNQVLYSNTDGTSCRFIEILDAETTNVQLFEKHLRPLVKAFLAGYNACIMCYGEIKSEIHKLLNGSRADKSGILNLTITEILRSISYGDISFDSLKDALSFHSFVLQDDGFSDLLKELGSKSDGLRVVFTINEGYRLEPIKETRVDSLSAAMNLCEQASRNYFGGVQKINQESNNEPGVFIFRVKLNGASLNERRTFRSKLTIVCCTGFEKIYPSMKNEVEFGNHTSLNLLSLYNLSYQLASGRPGIRKLPNYSVSNLTKLLYDEIGGNCYTRIILCLSDNPEPEIYSLLLRFTAQLTNITNSPVMNDECALLLAERARETQSILEQIINEQKTGTTLNNGTNLLNTDSSLLKLKEHIQELSQNLGKTHEELSHATDERVKLSKAWLLSEEDRIDANEKLAKTELELQEVTLKNKQLQLICEKATEAAKHSIELQRSNDMLNNYCTELKKKLGDLHEELNRMSIRNEELSRELLHQTAEQKSVLTFLANKNTDMKTKELPRFEKELDRVEVMLGTTAHHKKNAKINSIPETFGCKSNTFNTNNESKNQRLSENKWADLNNQKTLQYAEKQVKLDLIMKERDQLQIELTNTNRKLTRFLDHFKARLICHINGIARLVDATKSSDQLIVREGLYGLEKYIKHLIADMNATYKIRENQLVNICRSLNGQLHATREAMRKVMICYTKLRTQAIQPNASINDPGPTPQELINELRWSGRSNEDYLLNLKASIMAESTQPVK
ncbi:unnamed protein product [Schistosoma rodhaini]|nr:unnamed protein product [Schistosoma rodhaini]